jgi:hypothetical protein
MSPVGKTNWLRKEYIRATSPSSHSLLEIARDLLWDAIMEHERG